MTTCRTCKHWDSKHEQNRTDPTWNYSCPCLVLGKVLDIEIDQGPGYDAGGASVESIDTPPDFGCVHHEPVKP